MVKVFGIALLLALAACTGLPQRQSAAASACDASESSYECQVERYHNVAQ